MSLTLTLASVLAFLGPPPEPPAGSTRAPMMTEDRVLADVLVVEPGASCLARPTLLTDIESWRDGSKIDRPVTIRVHGSASDPLALGFEVLVDGEPVVERRFDPAPSDCADLHAVVALAIAIALDDTLAGELGILGPADPLAAVEQVQAREDDLPEPSTEPESPRRRGPAMALVAAGAMFAGLTPRLSGGALLSFDIRPRDHFDVRLGALATHSPKFDLDTGTVTTTVAAGRVDLCWGTAPLIVRLRACAGAAGGASISRGTGFTDNFTRTTPWFAAFADVDVDVHVIGPLALEVRVEGVFPLQRTRLEVRSSAGQRLASELFPVAGVLVAVGPRLEF